MKTLPRLLTMGVLATSLGSLVACDLLEGPRGRKRVVRKAKDADPEAPVEPEAPAAPPADKPAKPSGRVARRGPPPPPPEGGGDVDAPPVVLFVVLDTVRADHTSLCGYARPTTPTLEKWVDKGAVKACTAYSPAPWTHPSHASFFTGRSVVDHAAMWVTDSAVAINPVTRVRPLDEAEVTLAERFQQAGYQTVALSANMIVTPPSGLLQGFETVQVSKDGHDLRGAKFTAAFRKMVDKLDRNKPLFLFLNLYDAHDPYPAIPEGVEGLPPQAQLNLHPNQHDPKHPYYRYVKGLSSPEEEAPFLEAVANGYDWGIQLADATLGDAVRHLTQEGWLDGGFRMVVTSDHGEFLGEHRLLRHGGFLWEPVVKVPVLYVDTSQDAQPTLPEPFSGVWVHDLLLAGALPVDPVPAHAVSEPNDQDVLVGTVGAALWDGEGVKVTCIDGELARFDLQADPGETSPLPVTGHPLADDLGVLCQEVKALQDLPPPAEDEDYRAKLQAIGYLDE